ncbi:MAG: hypothetical protein IJE49_12640 [Agathobacter sp.]|nr:hypothetical protein [Agathobacter sp.]MBQ2902673.1 hypothetical protein [Agathobacter sp.]
MARRGLTGQLNMFDLYNSLETGEVEMVSLVPEFEEEPEVVEVPEVVEELEVEEELEVVEEPETVEELEAVEEQEVAEESHVVLGKEQVSMSRSYVVDGEQVEIAYINYNKVRITRGNGVPVVKEFASTKEAVDYYVEQMQEYEDE